MKVLIGTHAFHLHLLDFDPTTASLTQISKIELKEQPSFALQHPVHKELFYVNAWVDSIIYVIKVNKESAEFEIVSQAESGGGGPTHFILTPEGDSLLIANVSWLRFYVSIHRHSALIPFPGFH
jgi:6-phosphogluconolactonase (cycloisomerase 2 family)